ncbi:MAG: TonB-dependent receptor [Prevotellaceae bacterium]|jgi:outer membrane receptor protein involved in Fe transport|nr:TonB-dependent receptor [Prevotellaceae bacterium]
MDFSLQKQPGAVKNRCLLFLFLLAGGLRAQAPDSIKTVELSPVNFSSFRKTGAPESLPVAGSYFPAATIEKNAMDALSKLTGGTPNFYMPGYGAKLTSAIYIRGVGSRMNDPAVGLYVDNIPYLDKSMYDFDCYGLAGMEVLRGPQGALYGRNTMGGIISIYTPSPLLQQGTAFSLLFGNGNTLHANFAYSAKPGENTGVAAAMSYRTSGGFFTNRFANTPAGTLESFALRLRVDRQISNRWLLNYIISGENSRQNGYPYGLVTAEGRAGDHICYNEESYYLRRWLVNSLYVQYRGAGYTVESATSHQYFDDAMQMDQDFRPDSLFTLEQQQQQHGFTQEVIARSTGTKKYQWLFGAFGFYKGLRTDAPVTLKKDFFNRLIFSQIPPGAPVSLWAVEDCYSSGHYRTPSFGLSLFHQSTFRHFLFDRLTATAGLRVDYEKISIRHATHAQDFPVQGKMTLRPPIPAIPLDYRISVNISGEDAQSFLQLSPKFTLQYEPASGNRIYTSVSRGYRTGGYNFQLFSDVLQRELETLARTPETQTKDLAADASLIAYRPEYSWNYEAGAHGAFFQNRLQADVALFCIASRDRQITQFVPGGLGRMMKNAGRSQSYGAEVTLKYAVNDFSAAVNYGYTHATFTQYSDSVKTGNRWTQVDYKGKYIPFVPQHTLSASAEYVFQLRHCWLESLTVSAGYMGLGKIYFTENNDAIQHFYHLLDASVTAEKNKFSLSLWGKNITNETYNLFFFHGINGNSFAQQGLPLQFGVTLRKKL